MARNTHGGLGTCQGDRFGPIGDKPSGFLRRRLPVTSEAVHTVPYWVGPRLLPSCLSVSLSLELLFSRVSQRFCPNRKMVGFWGFLSGFLEVTAEKRNSCLSYKH